MAKGRWNRLIGALFRYQGCLRRGEVLSQIIDIIGVLSVDHDLHISLARSPCEIQDSTYFRTFECEGILAICPTNVSLRAYDSI